MAQQSRLTAEPKELDKTLNRLTGIYKQIKTIAYNQNGKKPCLTIA